MGGPTDYHTKWSKSDRERQIAYDITYVWTLKYNKRSSSVVQWLGLYALTAEGPGPIPGEGIKIPQASWYSNTHTNEQIYKTKTNSQT